MKISSTITKALLTKTQQYDKIVCFVHENPDCDAIGSAYAYYKFIKLNFPNKEVRIAGLKNLDPSFLFPFFKEDYEHVDKEFCEKSLGIIFDTPNQDRVLTKLNIFCDYTIQIDHHPKLEKFTNHSYVDSEASSACEILGIILHDFVKKNKMKISEEILQSLYFGLLTDTNRFMYPNSSYQTYELMSWMVSLNFDRQAVHNQLYLKKYQDLKLDHELFKLIHIHPEEKYATLFIDPKINKSLNIKSFAGKVYLIANIKEIEIWTLVYYDEFTNKIRGSIRSRTYDVSTIAKKFNGGGHKLASGFVLESFKDCKLLEEEIRKFLNNVNE